MAKKRTKSKRSPRKTPRGQERTLQTLKIVSGLSVLVLMVLGAGFLAHQFWGGRSAPTAAAVRPSERMPVPPVQAPQKPVYEVYSKSTSPAKPPTQLPQLPGDQPPLVAIIVDDIGYDRHIANQLMALNVPLTFSMLPDAPFSQQIAAQAREKGFEIMLHLPMEPIEYPAVNPGPGALLTDMTPDTLITQLNHDLEQFSGLKGVNNHMGSRLSTSPEQMRQIFSILKKRGLFYIDSRTSTDTIAEPSARLLQLAFAERDIFIDHEEDAAFIRSQLGQLIKRAKLQGYAVGIAHPHAITYQVLQEFLPQLKTKVALVQASTVVQQSMLASAGKSQAKR
jgi:uncharacterized protein